MNLLFSFYQRIVGVLESPVVVHLQQWELPLLNVWIRKGYPLTVDRKSSCFFLGGRGTRGGQYKDLTALAWCLFVCFYFAHTGFNHVQGSFTSVWGSITSVCDIKCYHIYIIAKLRIEKITTMSSPGLCMSVWNYTFFYFSSSLIHTCYKPGCQTALKSAVSLPVNRRCDWDNNSCPMSNI